MLARVLNRTYIILDVLGFDSFIRRVSRIKRGEGHLERLIDNSTHLSRQRLQRSVMQTHRNQRQQLLQGSR